MATIPEALKVWVEALAEHGRALELYTKEIDSVAQKVRPATRSLYRDAIARVSDLSEIFEPKPIADWVFGALASLEEVGESLSAATRAALDTSLQDEVVRRMSRTFAEEFNSTVRKVRDREADVRAASAKTISKLKDDILPALAKLDEDTVAKAYEASAGIAGAELYAALLATWASAGKNIRLISERAKDIALGIPPDNSEDIKKEIVARKNLHPIQAMEITFGLVPLGRQPTDSSVVFVDSTLPQAKYRVLYDLDALTMADMVKGSTTSSGLNFSLVQRLKPVRAEPIQFRTGEEVPGITVASGDAGTVVRSLDHGATREVLKHELPSAAYKTIGAGPLPRLTRIGELLEEAVVGESCNSAVRTIRDPAKMIDTYQSKADSLPSEFSLDELGQLLISRFAKEYDNAPPKTADEFVDAILGRSGKGIFGTYIASVLATLAKRGAEKQLLRNETSGGHLAARLFGDRALASRGSSQEVMLTILTGLRSSVTSTQLKLSKAYQHVQGYERARKIFADEKERRERALALYRDTIGEAFYSGRGPRSQLDEKSITIEQRLSLKAYVLEYAGACDVDNTC